MKLFGIFSAFPSTKEILLSNIWQYILKTVNVYTSLKKMFSKERSKAPKTTLTEFFTLCQKPDVLANSRRHWCMVMFHVISHGTNPVKMGATETRKTTSFHYRHIQKLRHWGDFTRYIQSNVSALFTFVIGECSRTNVF
ncbi:hypothetical protein TNCV_4679861 [Trichonephila clavipes]|nr:hypothetical protein TNCV_4679861 [Trichonephila clavipes]